MKALLIWPKARTDPDWGGDLGAIAEPLALEYLAGGLLQDHHTVRILDLRLHPGQLDDTIREFQPDIAGITAFSMHVRAGLKVMQRIKELKPDCLTIAGGHHATIFPEDFFMPQVDLVVKGEGVHPLNAIVRALEEGRDFSGIKGVWRREGTGFVFGGKQEPFPIDSLPFPAREVAGEDRQKYFIDWMHPVALLRTSVGCPYRCTFCSLWKVMDGRYHKRSIDQVIEEVKQIKEEFVFLVDDEAFIDSRRMEQMAQEFKRNGVHKRFFAYCRIDTIVRSRSVLQQWKEIGLERLFVGVDAISEKDLKEYNKRLTFSQIEEGLKIAQELGIEVLAQFVVNTDYTHDDFKHLIRFVEHFKLDYPTFTVLTPLPGTSLLAADFSNVTLLQENGRPDWDYFDTQSIVTSTRLSTEEFRRQYRGLFKVFSSCYSRFLVHKPAQVRQPQKNFVA
jgi:radical SAM superfamily enzyme YgiQ (UPF0313 family)